jgi:putative transposase
VKANQAYFAVATMCRVLTVSESGYWTWVKRPRSPRALSDIALTAKIEAIHRRSGGSYGAPRVHAPLQAEGVNVGHNRVACLMREAGLQGASRRRFVITTQRDRNASAAPDLVKRRFEIDAPDRLYVADIAYIPT